MQYRVGLAFSVAVFSFLLAGLIGIIEALSPDIDFVNLHIYYVKCNVGNCGHNVSAYTDFSVL
jgi:hypothetical protein